MKFYVNFSVVQGRTSREFWKRVMLLYWSFAGTRLDDEGIVIANDAQLALVNAEKLSNLYRWPSWVWEAQRLGVLRILFICDENREVIYENGEFL